MERSFTGRWCKARVVCSATEPHVRRRGARRHLDRQLLDIAVRSKLLEEAVQAARGHHGIERGQPMSLDPQPLPAQGIQAAATCRGDDREQKTSE